MKATSVAFISYTNDLDKKSKLLQAAKENIIVGVEVTDMGNNLIVYFSRKGENYCNGLIVNLAVGNTEVAANMIKELVGGVMFKIETVHDYPADYSKCTEIAKKEYSNGHRPKILDYVHHFQDYDNVFLCYPNWWSTMPMALFTFLESHDCNSKNIMPLCTHEGGGLGRSVEDIRKLAPRARVFEGLAVRGGDVNQARPIIENWLS